MGVHYSQEHGQPVPTYICQETATRRGGKVCRSVPGSFRPRGGCIGCRADDADDPRGHPGGASASLRHATAEMDTLRRQRIERTRYDPELARRR